MSMKEIRELARFCYFDLTREDTKKISETVDALNWKARKEGKRIDVQQSFSSEGGIAIPYVKLGLPPDFGEWLHLRYYPRIKYPRKGEDKTWHMNFIFNMNKRLNAIARNKTQKEAVLTGMKKLLEFVEKATGKNRNKGTMCTRSHASHPPALTRNQAKATCNPKDKTRSRAIVRRSFGEYSLRASLPAAME